MKRKIGSKWLYKDKDNLVEIKQDPFKVLERWLISFLFFSDKCFMKAIKKSLLTRTRIVLLNPNCNILQQIIKCKEIVLNTYLNLNYDEKTDEK